jgi:hypothetical protein
MYNVKVSDRETFRANATTILRGLHSGSLKLNSQQIALLRAYSQTKTFLKNNPNVLFIRADKGNTTVALDKPIYLKKMNALLRDTDTYTTVNRNPTPKLIDSLHSLLKGWLSNAYIKG